MAIVYKPCDAPKVRRVIKRGDVAAINLVAMTRVALAA